MQIAPIWIDDNWEPSVHGALAHFIYDWIGYKGTWPQVLAGGMLFVQAIIIVYIDFEHKLSRESTLFTGLFLILFSSFSLPLLHLSPNYFANVFLLLGISELLKTYRNTNSSGLIFNAGFFIGLASLFTPAYILFVFWLFAGLNLLRGFNIKERIIVLMGAFSIIFLVGVIHFWSDELNFYLRSQFIEGFSLFDFKTGNYFTYIHLGLIGIILLLTLGFRSGLLTKKVMQEQKKIDIFYWGMLISALVAFVQTGIQENHLLAVIPFIGLFVGMQFSILKRNIAELLHFLLFIMVLFLQYRPFFLP